jgi:glycosyltransferase involved in cell wall biosynthesis
MKICVDLRSLSKEYASGVENYCYNLTKSLLDLDKDNKYTLFFNSFGAEPKVNFNFPNAKVIKTNYPNKFLNIALKSRMLKMENLTGEQDWLFLPNLNQFNILSKTKLAITVHDLSPVVTPEFYDIKRRIWHHFLNYKYAFRRADIIFAVSEYTKNDLIRIFKIPEHKIKVVYPGIDQSESALSFQETRLRELRNIYALPKDFFVFVNTLEPRKNLIGLLKAFQQTKNNASLVILGKLGWKYKEIFKAIKNNKKKSKIKYLGYVPEAHKMGIIKMATALVYPSFYEGFGFQPLEAMAVGTPVIASSVTAILETTGGSALLVNPYNINEITFALEEIYNNKDLRENLVAKGLTQVKKFTWEKTGTEVLNILNNFGKVK